VGQGWAGPLACHLAAHGITQRDRGMVVIEQGHAMGRRSLIRARVTETAVQISGACATVAEGTLKLTS
jgi:predicted PhzF superfamily epimerase YddE/YHI9